MTPKQIPMKTETTFTKHIAGELINGVQYCVLCSKILADYRNTVSPDGFKASGWPENEPVYIKDNISQTSDPDTFELCTQTNSVCAKCGGKGYWTYHSTNEKVKCDCQL